MNGAGNGGRGSDPEVTAKVAVALGVFSRTLATGLAHARPNDRGFHLGGSTADALLSRAAQPIALIV
jgi:hypothetical protein